MTEQLDNEPSDLGAEPEPESPASEPELVVADASPFAVPEGVRLQEGAESPERLADSETSPFREFNGAEVEEE